MVNLYTDEKLNWLVWTGIHKIKLTDDIVYKIFYDYNCTPFASSLTSYLTNNKKNTFTEILNEFTFEWHSINEIILIIKQKPKLLDIIIHDVAQISG